VLARSHLVHDVSRLLPLAVSQLQEGHFGNVSSNMESAAIGRVYQRIQDAVSTTTVLQRNYMFFLNPHFLCYCCTVGGAHPKDITERKAQRFRSNIVIVHDIVTRAGGDRGAKFF
jgi:hypothetical protein